MRRLIFVAAVACAWPIGCRTGDPVDRLPPHHPPRVSPSRPKPVVRHRVRAPRPAQPVETARHKETWYPRNRKISPRWTTIIIHHSATEGGGAKLFQKHHQEQNGWDELGYHFVIGNGTSTPDGLIEVGSRWHKQKHGAHCKTPGNYHNEHGIGICLVGDFTKTHPTPKQLDSLCRLVRFLMGSCGVGSQQVTTHRVVTGKTRCPGPNFRLAVFRRSLSAPAAAASLP